MPWVTKYAPRQTVNSVVAGPGAAAEDAAGEVRTTTQAGLWSQAATWGGDPYPRAGDRAVINHAVTADITVTVGQGVAPATTANPVLAAAGGGSLAPGTYTLAYTAVTAAGVESSSPVHYSAITLAGGQTAIDVTLPALPAGAATYNLYKNSGPLWYKVTGYQGIGAGTTKLTTAVEGNRYTASGAVRVETTGSLSVNAGVSLTLTGHLVVDNTTFTMAAGSNLYYSGTLPGYLYLGDYFNRTNTRVHVNLAEGAPCQIAATGAGSISIAHQYLNCGRFDIRNTNVAGLGGITVQPQGAGDTFRLKGNVFDQCGLIYVAALPAADGYEFTNNTFLRGTAASAMDLRASGTPAGGVPRTLSGNVVDRDVSLAAVGATIDNNIFLAVVTDPYNSGKAASFAGNAYRHTNNNSAKRVGDWDGVYNFCDGSTLDLVTGRYTVKAKLRNVHWSKPIGLNNEVADSVVEAFAMVSDDQSSEYADGDWDYSPDADNTSYIHHCLFLPHDPDDDDIGYQHPGTLTTLLAGLGNRYENNTFFCGSQGMVALVESSVGEAGMITSLKSNIVWNLDGTAGASFNRKVYPSNPSYISNPDSMPEDIVASGAADYNCGWNLTQTGIADGGAGYGKSYQYKRSAGAIIPGDHDVDVDPKFKNIDVRFWRWVKGLTGNTIPAAAAGGTPLTSPDKYDYQAWGLYKLALKNRPTHPDYDANFTLANYLAYARDGFTAQNPALQGAAHDGGDIGALAVVPDVTPPTFSDWRTSPDGRTIYATLSETGCVPIQGEPGAGVTLSGTAATIGAWVIRYSSFTCYLVGRVYANETPLVSVAAGTIADASANDNAPVSNAAVTNNSVFASNDTTPPAQLQWEAVNPIVAGDGAVQLRWQATTDVGVLNGEGGYRVYRAPSSGGTFVLQNTASLLQAPGYTDTAVSNGTAYYYKVTAVDFNANESAFSTEQTATPAASGVTVQYLQRAMTSAYNKRLFDTADWQTFKAYLDANLNVVLSSSYQADGMVHAANYAMGYRALLGSDPTQAKKYADKALGHLVYGIKGNQRSWQGSFTLLGIGNGSNTAFTIPDADYVPASLLMGTATLFTQAVVRGVTDNDSIGAYDSKVVRVSNTNGGPANYAEGTDWEHGYASGIDGNRILWKAGGSAPGPGATYYVVMITNISTNAITYNVSGTAVTAAVAPSATQGVVAQYVYGTHTGGVTTLGYQQTHDNGGGLRNVTMDTTYATRYVCHLAACLDWVWDYAGFSAALKNEVMAELDQWFDYVKVNGYILTAESNYGCGHYAMLGGIAVALAGRHADAAAMATDVQGFVTGQLIPSLAAPTGADGTLYKGGWFEGWSYGALAVRNLMFTSAALEAAGIMSAGDYAAVTDYAADAIRSLLHSQPVEDYIYDGGDIYAYPLPFPGKNLYATLAALTTDADARGYANRVLQEYPGSLETGWETVGFYDPYAAPAVWTAALPLYYWMEGQGLLTVRSNWNYDQDADPGVWWTFHCGHEGACDHNQRDHGGLTLWRGSDNLLPHGTAVGYGNQTPQHKSKFGNLVMLDDLGAGLMDYPGPDETQVGPGQGQWQTGDGARITKQEHTATYHYAAGDYLEAFRKNSGSLLGSELNRSVLHTLDPDYLFVYDRATTASSAYKKRLQWHYAAATTLSLSGDAVTVTKGTSRLFGKTFSSAGITTSNTLWDVGGTDNVRRISTELSAPATKARFVTAFQVTHYGDSAMDPAAFVASGDGKVEGVHLGNVVAVFGYDGTLSGSTSYDITAANGVTVRHYVADAVAGHGYTVNGSTVTATAQGVLEFQTTGTGAAQTVTITF